MLDKLVQKFHLIYLFFISKNGRQIKKLKQKQG